MAQDMVWTELTSSGGLTDVAPSPRSAHAAAAYLDRFLLVFGGGSVVQLLFTIWPQTKYRLNYWETWYSTAFGCN